MNLDKIIEVNKLRKSYTLMQNSVDVLQGINFTVDKGEFISIMGPSGSGKSTLLQIIGGLDNPSCGNVIISGNNIGKMKDRELSTFRRRNLGFIFQFFNLVEGLTALENVALPMLLDGKSFSHIQKKGKNLLAQVGLEDKFDHYPNQLSGGQMQRVAFCRALINEPDLILADEPTGNLDHKASIDIMRMLAKISQEHKQTILMVTHDSETVGYGTRVIHLIDGNIEKDCKPSEMI